MGKRLKPVPKFANQAAERAFWEKNDSTAYLDWKKAQPAVFPNLKPSTQTISLRLPQHLLDSIKTAANARDVPYQSLTKFGCRRSCEVLDCRAFGGLPKDAIRAPIGRFVRAADFV